MKVNAYAASDLQGQVQNRFEELIDISYFSQSFFKKKP